ncbi:hypothetical protein HZA55_00630 [Candidatus Poribacteria bacterium]|nr:hypothetical protein [Candidatus Poribacteria bacterium]
MNLIKKIFLLLILLLSNNIIAETLPYNEDVFSAFNTSWISAFKYYEIGKIDYLSQNQNKNLTVNLGENLGVRQGFIYDIYHDGAKTGQLMITTVLEDSSEAKIIAKNGVIKTSDTIIFTNQIDSDENSSYTKRMEKKLTGKITIVEENFCFIDINKNNGVELKMRFDIYNKENEKIGTIEVADTSKDKPSVCNIIEKNSKFGIGQIVKSSPRSAAQWLELGILWETQPNNKIDVFYALEKAFNINPGSNEIIGKLITLADKIINEFIGSEEYEKAITYINKVKNFSPKYEEKYKELQVKVLEKGKNLWRTGNYILAIKYFEQLPKSDEIVKLISDSYIEVGNEFNGISNNDAAIYCFEQSLKFYPDNINYNKNLFAMYEVKNLYSKAIVVLNRINELSTNAQEKKWAAEKIDIMTRAIEKRAPNYTFLHINGNNFNLDSIQGYVIILVLWNTTLDNMVEELRFLTAYMDKYQNKPIKLIAINNDQKGIDFIKNFIGNNEIKISYDIAFTADNLDFIFTSEKVLQVSVLDKAGKLAYKKTGKLDEKELNDLLNIITLE